MVSPIVPICIATLEGIDLMVHGLKDFLLGTRRRQRTALSALPAFGLLIARKIRTVVFNEAWCQRTRAAKSNSEPRKEGT